MPSLYSPDQVSAMAEKDLMRRADSYWGGDEGDDARSDAAASLLHDDDALARWFGDLVSDGEFYDLARTALRMFGSSKADRIDADATMLGETFARILYKAEEVFCEAAASKPQKELFEREGLDS